MSGLAPRTKPGEPVWCAACGHKWPQDPCFEVTCPTCGALPGQYCKRPSGHQGPFVSFHAQRDLEAARQGCYDHGDNRCGLSSKDFQDATGASPGSAAEAPRPAQLAFALR